MPPDPTQKQEKKSNSKSLNDDRKPPKDNYYELPSESPILLWREIPMAWGTTTDSLNPEINHFQYAIEIKYLRVNPRTWVTLFGKRISAKTEKRTSVEGLLSPRPRYCGIYET